MHAGMAANLQRLLQSEKLSPESASGTLLLYNRTSSKAEALSKDQSSKVVQSPADMAQQCSIVCMMLADDVACGLIVDELLSAGGQCLQGKVVINHSTVTPDFAKTAEHKVAAAGGAYLSVPVWGR
jgi:3-hydroxyisobutyrate dehydrogenase